MKFELVLRERSFFGRTPLIIYFFLFIITLAIFFQISPLSKMSYDDFLGTESTLNEQTSYVEDDYSEDHDRTTAFDEISAEENKRLQDKFLAIPFVLFFTITFSCVIASLINQIPDTYSMSEITINHLENFIAYTEVVERNRYLPDKTISRKISFHNLAYAFHNQKSHNSLILYNNYINSVDREVIVELCELRGMSWGTKWSKNHLRQIRDELVKEQVEEFEYPNPHRSLSRKILAKYLPIKG